jgi:hypothetical protein
MSLMQAMKVENMVKLKEEFDYKSLCRRLETELDRLVAENERQIKAREDNEDDSARSLEEAQQCVFEAESKLASALEVRYCCLPQCCSPADSIRLQSSFYGCCTFSMHILCCCKSHGTYS